MRAGSLRLLCILSFLVCSSGHVWALDPARRVTQYAHNAWTIQDGYLAAAPTAITQTTDGYLWIGTEAGIVRFDGVQFDASNPLVQREPIYATAGVASLLGARDGSLWISADISRGLQRTLRRWSGDELVTYSVNGLEFLYETRAGDVWLSDPFCQIVGRELKCHGKAEGVPDMYGSNLAEDALGHLWLGGDRGLFRWSPAESSFYSPPGLEKHVGTGSQVHVAIAPDGSVWAGMPVSGSGLGLQHLVQGKWTSTIAPGVEGSEWQVRQLLFDREGALWIGTSTDGLYHLYGQRLDHYRRADGLSDDAVRDLYEDREGNIWVLTARGIDKFRNTVVTAFSARDGLCSIEANSLLVAQDETLWVGNFGTVTRVEKDQISCLQIANRPADQVTSLFEDQAHQVWIGLNDGMTLYEHGKFTPITKGDGKSPGMIVSMTEDVDHNIWLVSGGRHRALFRIQDRQVRDEVALPGISAPHEVAADPGGGLWLGLMNGDLARYRNGHTEVVHFDLGQESYVKQVEVSPDGAVFAATGAGLLGWKDGRAQTLTKRNGLPCDAVNSFILDKAASLWLYLQCGFVEITATQLKQWWQTPGAVLQPHVLDALDGMQPGGAFFQSLSAMTPDGRIWFGGNVLQMIDPVHPPVGRVLPLVHIERVIADQKPYVTRSAPTLPALTRNLEIDYTAPSFAIPQRVKFRYRLEGHDAGWQEPGRRRQAFYSDLRPGKYRFHVIASDEDGLWNETGATLDFSVAAAWYQTVWFAIGCMLAALLILVAGYRLRLLQISRQMSARFDERLAERTRIARDLHDTLMQTIQASKLVVDDALEKPGNLARRPVEQLAQWLQRAVHEGRAALDSLRAPATVSGDLVKSLTQLVEERRHENTMELAFAVHGEVRDLHPVVHDEMYRIADEAIRNAMAHSQGTLVELELKYEQDLMLRVRDSGVGMDAAMAAHGRAGHFGLPGMRERASRIGGRLNLISSPAEGTDITIVIPGKLAYSARTSRRYL